LIDTMNTLPALVLSPATTLYGDDLTLSVNRLHRV
jgi:hypothetical protein